MCFEENKKPDSLHNRIFPVLEHPVKEADYAFVVVCGTYTVTVAGPYIKCGKVSNNEVSVCVSNPCEPKDQASLSLNVQFRGFFLL